MSTQQYNENNIEALRLNSPEIMTEQRKGIISMAVANLRPHARIEAQTVEPAVIPQSAEVSSYEQTQADRIAKDTAELFEDRARHDALNAFTGFEQNPLFGLEDENA